MRIKMNTFSKKFRSRVFRETGRSRTGKRLIFSIDDLLPLSLSPSLQYEIQPRFCSFSFYKGNTRGVGGFVGWLILLVSTWWEFVALHGIPGIKIIQTSILFIALSAFGIFNSGLILDRRPNGIVISPPLWFNFIKYRSYYFENYELPFRISWKILRNSKRYIHETNSTSDE